MFVEMVLHQKRNHVYGVELMYAIIRMQFAEDQSELHELLLRDALPDNYQVITAQQATPEEAFAFDLCILDEAVFTLEHETILAWKKRVEPLFLPILLLCEAEQVRMLPPQMWDVIDDVISLPLAKAELLGRIRVLLRAREASKELQQLKVQQG